MENNELITQKESIKLMKMSKGYQWEIKSHLDKHEDSTIKIDDSESLNRLNYLNKQLQEKYGNDNKLNEVEKK